MKKASVVLLSFTLVIFAQMLHAQEILKGNPGMWPSMIKYKEVRPAFNSSGLYIVDANGKPAIISAGVIKNISSDAGGMEHYRYQQTVHGIAIENAELLVHVANGRIISQNGKWIKDLPSSLGAAPVITEADALNRALKEIGAQKYKWQIPGEEAFLKRERSDPNASFFPNATRVYYSGENDVIPAALRLAYKFDIYAQQPVSRQLVFVDALDGKILGKRELIHVTNVTGTAQTAYSGAQTITTDYTGTNYRLRETARGNGINTYNLQTGTNYAAAIDFTDGDNNWNNVNTAKDEYAADAHWGAEKTYDYYLQTYNRNSINDSGMALNSYVHYSTGYFNAYWDGERMTYGDGDAAHGNKPLTALDVCGHEITHGVTEKTSGLVYSYESGAMNEGFSDIFGTAIEAFARPANHDWLIGSDFFTIRSMSDPNAYNDPDTYQGTYWYSGSADNGGVHTNSGVLNYWFYLLTVGGAGVNDHGVSYNVSGIGMTRAAAIAYRLNTVYLVSTSDYYAARVLGIQAAEDLYGIGSNEALQTANAWTAVGLYAATCNATGGLTATNIRDRSATLKWTAESGAVYYQVQYKANSSPYWSSQITVTADSLNITGLTNSTLYDWKVRSSCNATFSYAQFTTAAPICTAPTGITAIPGLSTAQIFWYAAPYAVSYDVEYKLPVDNAWTLAGNTTGTSFTITGLTSPTTYDCRIKTNCSFGISGYNTIQFTTTLTPCDAPTGLAFSYSNNVSTFTWNAVPFAFEYIFELDWAGGGYGLYDSVVTTNSLSLANLMQGGNFQFRVRSHCNNGYSLPSASFLFTTPCSEPGNLTTTNITTTSATLNWVPAPVNNGNTAFSVYYRLANTNNAWTSLGNTTASSINVSGLLPGTQYQWKVRKLCSALNSTEVFALFTTTAPPACNVPTGLSSSGVTATQANLAWNVVIGAVSYSIQYKPAVSSTWSTAVTTTATSRLITGLVASTLYDWRVMTNCSLNASTYASAQFTTSTTSGCNVPTGLIATGIGNTGAVLGWNAVSGVSSYRLQYKPSTTSNWTTVSNISTNTYTLANLVMNTTYQFQLSSKCGSLYSAYSPVATFTTLNCVSGGNNTAQWIDLFKLGSINRTSGAEPGGYVNAGLSTSLVIGSSANTGQISAGFSGSAVEQRFCIYIDLNRNGSFNETNERILAQTSITGTGNINFSINIPSGATPGLTGMRVVMRKKSDGAVEPCSTGFLGETEDYLVNLTTTSLQGIAENVMTLTPGNHSPTGMLFNAGIRVWPNPSNGIFQVSFNDGFCPVQYEILNTSGAIIKKVQVVSSKILHPDISALPAGLYLLKLIDRNGKTVLQKLVKE